MNEQKETYNIVGRPLPYREDAEVVSLAEITIANRVVEMVLGGSSSIPKRIAFEIWEGTIHELETLSTSLRRAAESAFPQAFELSRRESWIGQTINLKLVVECEVGYSLGNPSSDRCTFFCSSRDRGLRDRNLGVQIGVALMGAYGEVVMEPSQANDFADWLDSHIERFG
jgi:hypothetical protein